MAGQSQGSAVEREVFGPRRLLIWAIVLSTLIAVGSAVGWAGIPAEFRAKFNIPQILTLLLIAVGGIAVMMSMGLSRIIADRDGLTVRNAIVLTKRVPWSEVRDVRWGPGASWATVILDDDPTHPTRIPVLALQTADGRRTEEAVRRLRQLVREHHDQPNG